VVRGRQFAELVSQMRRAFDTVHSVRQLVDETKVSLSFIRNPLPPKRIGREFFDSAGRGGASRMPELPAYFLPFSRVEPRVHEILEIGPRSRTERKSMRIALVDWPNCSSREHKALLFPRNSIVRIYRAIQYLDVYRHHTHLVYFALDLQRFHLSTTSQFFLVSKAQPRAE